MGDIGMIKEVLLAWKLCSERGGDGGVVDHRDSVGLGVYRREEGEETINTKQTNATQMHGMAICCAGGDLTQCYTLQTERENIWEYIPGFRHLSDR